MLDRKPHETLRRVMEHRSQEPESPERCGTLQVDVSVQMPDGSKFDNRLRSALDSASARAKANRAALLELLVAIRAEEDAIRRGGGEKAVEAQHAKGRLAVRERLNLLLDEGSEFHQTRLVGGARNVFRIRWRARCRCCHGHR